MNRELCEDDDDWQEEESVDELYWLKHSSIVIRKVFIYSHELISPAIHIVSYRYIH